jgi:PIN domain nuclease of toxin-antitoxin system
VKLLLDTHVLLWWTSGSDRLPEAHREALAGASPEAPVFVSDVSLLEIATLHRLGKIELKLPLRDWLEHAVAPPLVRRFGITPAVAAETAALPDGFPRDPADRVLAATARVLGATLLTCDRQIADSGAVPVL